MSRIPACGTDLSLLQIVQTEYVSHTISFSMGIWGEEARAWG